MNFEIILVALALHTLIWEKLPHWGTWFNRLLALLPKPLQALYEGWRCPYCFGFWAALVGHSVTQIPTLPLFVERLAAQGMIGVLAGYFFDALASAVVIQIGKLGISALGWPAIKGEQASVEYFGQK
nr:hypothetical protein [Reinekea sp. G2M2-21]